MKIKALKVLRMESLLDNMLSNDFDLSIKRNAITMFGRVQIVIAKKNVTAEALAADTPYSTSAMVRMSFEKTKANCSIVRSTPDTTQTITFNVVLYNDWSFSPGFAVVPS